MLSITEIDALLRAALEPMKAGAGVQTIKAYGGELNPQTAAQSAGFFPAVLTAYGGSEFASLGQVHKETLTFVLFLCSSSLLSQEEAGAGAYALISGVEALLPGLRLSQELSPLRIKSVRPEVMNSGLSVYSLGLACDRPVNPAA